MKVINHGLIVDNLAFTNPEVDLSAEESKSEGNSELLTSLKPNIQELEMLLEAYFAQIDGILQKLSGVSICHLFSAFKLHSAACVKIFFYVLLFWLSFRNSC